jgi:hypothetical protein
LLTREQLADGNEIARQNLIESKNLIENNEKTAALVHAQSGTREAARAGWKNERR